MQRGSRRRRVAVALLLVMMLIGASATTAVFAVLSPTVDTPTRVDGIVVVSGAADDRYAHASALITEGTADQLLVSRPSGASPRVRTTVAAACSDLRPVTPDGIVVRPTCFAPDTDTTEGETRAATAIARERGWHSLLVVTYWGHVSRVRLYFDQCFDGDVHVTDTPRPLEISRRHAVLHESGGYVKALVTPAC